MIELYKNAAVANLGTGDIDVSGGIIRDTGIPVLRMQQLTKVMKIGTDLLAQDVEREDIVIDLIFHKLESLNIVIDGLISIREKYFKPNNMINKTYEIKTIVDFLHAAMMTDDLDGLFEDFRIMTQISIELAKHPEVNTDELIKHFSCFRWTDDGIREGKITIVASENNE